MALQIQDPRQRRTGPFSDATTAAVPPPGAPGAADTLPTQVVRPTFMDKLAAGPRAFGGLPNAPAPGSAMARADAAALRNQTNVLGMPTGYTPPPRPLRPGEAAPDVNAPAPGTRLGNLLSRARQSVVNQQTDVFNAGTRAGAGLANAFTYLPRAELGFVRDAARGAVGASTSPNAGQPLSGFSAPTQLQQPFKKPAIDFALTHQVPSPADMSGSMGGGPATPVRNPNYDPAADNISQRNLAAANRLTAPADFSNVRGGVVTTAAPAAAGGVTVTADNGQPRRLNYGAMVNGVPTFSDGTGGMPGTAGSIPRTMSDKAIAALGTRAGGVAEQSFGGAPGAAAASSSPRLTMPTNQGPNQALLDMFAASDANSIAKGDTRTALGSAARSLRFAADHGNRGAAKQLAELSAGVNDRAALRTKTAGDLAVQGQANEGALANTDATGRNALDAIQLQGQNQLANTALGARLRPPAAGELVQAADNSYNLVSPTTAAVTPVLLGGQPLRGQPKNPPAPIFTTPGGAPALQARANAILGVDQNTGLMTGQDGKQRLPTAAEDLAARQQAARDLMTLGNGQPTAVAPKAPALGTVTGGYRFKGGDPASQSNWEKV
jgi:hypothetical protein